MYGRFPFILIFLTLCSLICSVMSLPAQVYIAGSDGIAAVVNNEVITLSQVRDLSNVREQSLRDLYSGRELEAKVAESRKEALKDLIDRQLVLQEFKKLQKDRGATIPDYVIDDRVNTVIREEFGGDRAAFVRTLRAQGYTPSQFRQIEKDKVVVQAMRAQFTNDNNIVVSPRAIEKYYLQNRQTWASPEQIKLRMIVLRNNESEESKLSLAKEIRQKLIEGADFARMAEIYSEDGSQETGGDWGWIGRDTLNEQLSTIAFSLKAGEVSDVLEMGGSYYILSVEARKNASIKPLSDVQEEIEKRLVQEERSKIQDRWLSGLRNKAYIKIYQK